MLLPDINENLTVIHVVGSVDWGAYVHSVAGVLDHARVLDRKLSRFIDPGFGVDLQLFHLLIDQLALDQSLRLLEIVHRVHHLTVSWDHGLFYV